MTSSVQAEPHSGPLCLTGTAADLMTPDPLSLRADAPLAEALGFLIDRGFSAAPVIDETGHPVGVISRSDLLIHEREYRAAAATPQVRDLMTPAVFSVPPEMPESSGRAPAESPRQRDT